MAYGSESEDRGRTSQRGAAVDKEIVQAAKQIKVKRKRRRRSVSSSPSSSETSERKAKRRKDRKRRKKEKKKNKISKHGKSEDSSEKEAGPVQLSKHLRSDGDAKYSSITGSKIQLKLDRSKADKDEEAKRKQLLEFLNSSYE